MQRARNVLSLLLVRNSASMFNHNLYNKCVTRIPVAWLLQTVPRLFSSASCSNKRETTKRPSYVYGTSGDKTLIFTTIGNKVDEMLKFYGDREAIVDCNQGIRKTFAQYKKDIDKLATGLQALNLRKGDRVAIWSPNRYEWCLTQFATAKLGIILTTLNPAYQSAELEYCMKKVGVKGLIAVDTFKTQNYYQMLTSIVPEVPHSLPGQIKSSNLPNLETVIMISDKHFPGTISFKDAMTAGEKSGGDSKSIEELQKELDPDDPIMIQFTSGTTGKSKAVTLSHHNLLNGNIATSYRLGFNDPNKLYRRCNILPLFHIISYMSVLHGVLNGICSVFPAPSFSAGSTLQCIQDEKCTAINATPTMYIDMMNHPDFSKTDFSSLESGVIGGSFCHPKIVQDIIHTMHCSGLTIGYGCTETCGAIFLHNHSDLLETKLSSDGTIYEFLEGKIVDDQDKMVPIGELGEICVRGYKVMKGYWNDEDTTKEVLKDGWFHTGDLGLMNEDLSVKVIDRKKDIIIRGGENISPTEIELFLQQHPKIVEVYVIGVPDERMGEEVCAWIKLKENEKLTIDEIKEFCHKKISHFKIPRYVKFVSEFPKTATGKAQKYKMRHQIIHEIVQI